jgi:hypothetical protein
LSYSQEKERENSSLRIQNQKLIKWIIILGAVILAGIAVFAVRLYMRFHGAP